MCLLRHRVDEARPILFRYIQSAPACVNSQTLGLNSYIYIYKLYFTFCRNRIFMGFSGNGIKF